MFRAESCIFIIQWEYVKYDHNMGCLLTIGLPTELPACVKQHPLPMESSPVERMLRGESVMFDIGGCFICNTGSNFHPCHPLFRTKPAFMPTMGTSRRPLHNSNPHRSNPQIWPKKNCICFKLFISYQQGRRVLWNSLNQRRLWRLAKRHGLSENMVTDQSDG